MKEPNLLIEDDFLPDSYALYNHLVLAIAWAERMRVRKTASFGYPYNYSGINYAGCPMLDELIPVVKQLEECFGFRPNNCLANYYEEANHQWDFTQIQQKN